MSRYLLHKDGTIYAWGASIAADPDMVPLRDGFDPRTHKPDDYLESPQMPDVPARAAITVEAEDTEPEPDPNDPISQMRRFELFEFARLNGFEVRATIPTADLRALIRQQVAAKVAAAGNTGQA